MNRTQKILAAFAFASAAAANTAARAEDQSAFFDCARRMTDGAVASCPTPEADRAEATFIRKAEAEAARWEHATAARFRKTEVSPASDVDRPRTAEQGPRTHVSGQ
jgi:hypothetical protein